MWHAAFSAAVMAERGFQVPSGKRYRFGPWLAFGSVLICVVWFACEWLPSGAFGFGECVRRSTFSPFGPAPGILMLSWNLTLNHPTTIEAHNFCPTHEGTGQSGRGS